MKIWAVWDDEHHFIHHVFATEELAKEYARGGGRVKGFEVEQALPEKWTVYHKGALIFPDRTVSEWGRAEETEVEPGPVKIHPAARSLSHAWEHCGDRVWVEGGSREQVERVYAEQLAVVTQSQTGRCSSVHENTDADGVSVFQASYDSYRLAGTGIDVEWPCSRHLDHDWGPMGKEREVAPGQFNQSRSCRRCYCVGISFTSTYALGANR